MTNQNNPIINGDKWTTDKPTQEGYYWAWDGATVDMVDIRMLGELVAFIEDIEYELDEFTHWIGPLEKPEPPNG